MERTAWTDERLGDLANRIDAGFSRVDADIRELKQGQSAMRVELRGEITSTRNELKSEIGALRGEIGALRGEIGGEIGAVRGEIGGEIGAVRGEIDAFRLTLVRIGGGIMVGMVGVIAAILVRGV